MHPAKKKETVHTSSWKVYLYWNLIFQSFLKGGMLCSKHRLIYDVNNEAKIEDENYSDETADFSFHPKTSTLCMNEKQRDQRIQQMYSKSKKK